MTEEYNAAEIKENTVLEKFEGEATPENLVERIHIEDGEVVKVEKFEGGTLVQTENVKEVE